MFDLIKNAMAAAKLINEKNRLDKEIKEINKTRSADNKVSLFSVFADAQKKKREELNKEYAKQSIGKTIFAVILVMLFLLIVLWSFLYADSSNHKSRFRSAKRARDQRFAARYAA